MRSIPIVDFTEAVNQSSPDNIKFVQGIRKFGGVCLVNHGIESNLIGDAFLASREFFELPNVSKVRFQKRGNGNFDFQFQTDYHGYTRPAVLKPTEFREAFDICGSGRFYPNNEIPRFKKAFEDLETELVRLAKCVARILGSCIGMDERHILKMTKNLTDPSVRGFTSLRSLYYPALTNEEIIPEENTRCEAHTDLGLFTLLLQDNIGGLKIQKGATWIKVRPVSDSIFLLMGNIWQELTSLPALVHRVDFPEDVDQRKLARQSMTYFVHPDSSVIIEKVDANGNLQRVTVEEITMRKAYREGHRWKQ